MQVPHVPMRLAVTTEAELFGLQFALGYLEGAVKAKVTSTRPLPSGEIDLTLEPATKADRDPVFQLVREPTA